MTTIKNIYLILLLFLFSTSIAFASTGNNYYISFNDGTNNVNNIGYETFLCTSADNICNTVQSQLNDGNTNSSNTYHFTALGTSYLVNYASYFYAEGFIPAKAILSDYGTGEVASTSYSLHKLDDCISQIISVSVVNEARPNMPLEINVNAKLNASTASAFRLLDSAPTYQPASWRTTYRHLFSATTFVEVAVEKDGVYQETLFTPSKDIFADETESFSFIYVPQSVGVYTFTFKAYVNDNQCIASTPSYATDTTNVVLENATDYSYSLLKNLTFSPIYPQAGDDVTFSVDYLSNYVSETQSITAIPTLIEFSLFEGYNSSNPLVGHSQSTYSDSTTTEFGTASYIESITNPGWYTLVINATPIGNGDILSTSLTLLIYVGDGNSNELTYNHTLTIVNEDGELLSGVRGVFNNSVRFSNSFGNLYFLNLANGNYVYSLSLAGYNNYSGSFNINNQNSSSTAVMTRNTNPPVTNETYKYTLTIISTNGTKLSGVRGVLDNSIVEYSNADGILVFSNLSNGNYNYILSKDGYYNYTSAFTISSQNGSRLVSMVLILEPIPPVIEESYSKSALIDIDFDAVDYNSISDSKYLIATFRNSGSADINNIKVTISIPELNIWDKVGPFDLNSGRRIYKQVLLDSVSYEPGWYYLRVQIDGTNYNRARWYEVYLK